MARGHLPKARPHGASPFRPKEGGSGHDEEQGKSPLDGQAVGRVKPIIDHRQRPPEGEGRPEQILQDSGDDHAPQGGSQHPPSQGRGKIKKTAPEAAQRPEQEEDHGPALDPQVKGQQLIQEGRGIDENLAQVDPAPQDGQEGQHPSGNQAREKALEHGEGRCPSLGPPRRQVAPEQDDQEQEGMAHGDDRR